MAIPPEMLVLARRLLTNEDIADEPAEPIGARVSRVYERLRQCIGAFAGPAAFYSLASRALALSRPKFPDLGAVRINGDGSLQGLGQFATHIEGHTSETDKDQADDWGVVLIAQLLGLLDVFLGKALALRLLRDAWPGATFDESNSGNGRKS